jgi:hypothetical protein
MRVAGLDGYQMDFSLKTVLVERMTAPEKEVELRKWRGILKT